MALPRLANQVGVDLSLFFACHHHLLCLPVRRIERLVLGDEAVVVKTSSEARSVPVVKVGGLACAAWNLGRMFELPALKQAWVVMRVPHAGAEVPIALAVGRCFLVGQVNDVSPVPPGLFRERRSALWGTFPREAIRGDLGDRKSTRLNSSHNPASRMPSSA
jgi:hypothetical protein